MLEPAVSGGGGGGDGTGGCQPSWFPYKLSSVKAA